jgi:threonine/homoserine/homoserine lactone efflux protein
MVALFYIAFLPAAALPLWLQFLTLSIIVNAGFSAADAATVFLTSSVLGGLQRRRVVQRVARIAGGSVLIGLGARLALSRD